ncbi:exosome nuclease subunit [Exophiala xenobiotica]|nr:exosome nuclease subunit [Exophiala xenobiotica]KAK5290722.1 exosome nuclease subunit [Exophiala xenobiotica]KAK5413411.1 exosome nuclease subunit [Exophiala xenobiotica]KAK5497528.1 exosome nuclease subunit [Exophiala xenobiotica]
MDLTTDFKSFQDKVQGALVSVTRSAAQISNQDLSFHRSSSDKLSRSLDHQNAHLLRLTNKLLKAATKDTSLKAPTLQNSDGVDDNWRRVVDVVDDLLEKADSALDEISGVIKRQSPSVQDGETPSQAARPGRNRFSNTMQKPQVHFDRKVDNTETSPFKPLLKSKPHAKVPLQESIGEEESGYKHPYALEIENYTYPASVYEVRPPIPFAPPEQSEPIYVATEEGVQEMLQELRNATEIAIDLEHNDARSYIGLVCLMQISTREKDWVIDTLKPWRENLQVLNEVFTDPNILKVFHGSNMDMIWLQRDLGLYVVGLFDTFHASTALQFQGRALKHLLQKFANFEAQKQYQTADWRVRPLPQELLDYARSDTHFLLHIYDNIRNMLIEASTSDDNLLDFVLRESKKEALQVYERPIYDVDTGRGSRGWLNLLMQRSVAFSPQQFSVFRAVHEWRDRKARETDEGLQLLCSNNIIFQIADSMPTSTFNFHAAIRGNTKTISNHLPELIEVVKKAKAEGKDGKTVQEVLKHAEDAYGLTPRRKPLREQQPSNYEGVGSILKQLMAGGDVGGTGTGTGTGMPSPAPAPLNYDGNMDVDMDTPVAMRSSASHFWGAVTPQHVHLPTEAVTAVAALNAILPLAAAFKDQGPETAQPAATTPAQETQTQPQPQIQAQAQAQQPSKNSDIFTLKERSRAKKRKADDVEAGPENETLSDGSVPTPAMAPTTNGSSSASAGRAEGSAAVPAPEKNLDPAYEDKRQAKKQKKAEKKARKEAEKLAADQQAAAQAPSQPFDYANAESLLTPTTQTPAAQASANSQAAKRMNPFAKALDASAGARRGKMGKELAGKSMTFKS